MAAIHVTADTSEVEACVNEFRRLVHAIGPTRVPNKLFYRFRDLGLSVDDGLPLSIDKCCRMDGGRRVSAAVVQFTVHPSQRLLNLLAELRTAAKDIGVLVDPTPQVAPQAGDAA